MTTADLGLVRGPAGKDGTAGKAATVRVGTVTAGSAPSVTNGGTGTDAVLNFVLPENTDADTVDGKHASEFATAEQGKKADGALQASGGGTVSGITYVGYGASFRFKDSGGYVYRLMTAGSGDSRGFFVQYADPDEQWIGNPLQIMQGVCNINGRAVMDGNGNNIANTYLPRTGGTMTGNIPFITSSGWKVHLLPDAGGTNGGFAFACQDKNGNWGNTALIFDGATGAWRFRGGDADGYFRFGTSNTGLEWYTASGTRYRLRPWSPSNVFQITRTTSGGAEQGILNIYETSAEFIGNADTATVASKLRISGADASVFYNADSDWVYFSRDGKIVNYHQAKRAVADESNNNIKSTYLASIDTSGNTIRAKNKNGSVLYTVTPPYAAKAANAANATFPISYGKIVSRGDQKLAIYASGETDRALFFGVTSVAKLWTHAPDYDYQLCLGDPNYRWAQIYSNQPTINTSDRDQKTEIRALEPDTALAFLAALEPVSYKMRDGTSGRTHWGLIAQDVWKAMQQAGLSDMDFAGYCRDVAAERVQIVRQVPVTDPDDGDILGVEDTLEEEDIPAETEEGGPRYIYGLRYEEFISLALFGAQEALRRTEMLEAENKQLKEALAELTESVRELKKDRQNSH